MNKEKRTYLTRLGLCIALAFLLAWFPNENRLVMFLSLLILCVVAGWVQNAQIDLQARRSAETRGGQKP